MIQASAFHVCRLCFVGFMLFTITKPTQASVEDYLFQKTQSILDKHSESEGNFIMVVLPMPIEAVIANSYSAWKEKRFTEEEMVQESMMMLTGYAMHGRFIATLYIFFVGDWSSKGKTSLDIPEDIADYILLENDQGDFVRCSDAPIGIGDGTVNSFNKIVNISLSFPVRFPKTRKGIFENTSKITFVVNGLGFKRNKFVYKMPLSDMYSDAPPEFREILYKSGIWKRPTE